MFDELIDALEEIDREDLSELPEDELDDLCDNLVFQLLCTMCDQRRIRKLLDLG